MPPKSTGAPTPQTCSAPFATGDSLDPCSRGVEQFGRHLHVGPPKPGRDMERMVGILGQRQCRHCVSEPFDEGHEELHGRERIARSLQEKHRDAQDNAWTDRTVIFHVSVQLPAPASSGCRQRGLQAT